VSFFECEFPTTISYKAIGGPGMSTTVNQALSGQEARNRNWAVARGKWEVSLQTPIAFGGNRQAFVDLLNSFFLVVGGKADGFRLKDHKDFKAVNQLIVDFNGSPQLAITRTIGDRSYVQIITKPITSAIKDYQGNALADTVVLHGTNTPVLVDAATGIVTGHAAGTAVDFQFHYPVRFDVDDLAMQVEESDVQGGNPLVSVHSIILVELRPPNY
jgi:uncharacterized protein (TIGR02217 family)